MKQCYNCNTENPLGATFCRKCGLPFEHITISKEDLEKIKINTQKWKTYPQWKKPITGFVIRFIFSVCLAIVLSCLTGLVLYNMGQDTTTQIIFASIVGFLLLFIGVYFCRKQMPTKQEKDMFLLICDKVEPYYYTGIRHSRKRKMYKIFVKDNKMGVLDVCNYKIAIPPHYSFIKWKKRQSSLTVSLNNDTFDINVKGEFL